MSLASLIGWLFNEQFAQKKLVDHFDFWQGDKHPRVKEIEISLSIYVI